jgi:acetyl esterase/lipase
LIFISAPRNDPCRAGAAASAVRAGARCYAADYRVPPEHPFPAALDDCLAVYADLVERYDPKKIVVGGASAGGNLAAALMLRARDEGLPLPAGLVLLTPELDLTESGDSFGVNKFADVVLVEGLPEVNALYAGGHNLAHPYLSPLFGDFSKGFPPTLLQAGTRDVFLSNVARMHTSLRRAKVPVEILLCEAMPHGGFAGCGGNRDVPRQAASIKRGVRFLTTQTDIGFLSAAASQWTAGLQATLKS